MAEKIRVLDRITKKFKLWNINKKKKQSGQPVMTVGFEPGQQQTNPII